MDRSEQVTPKAKSFFSRRDWTAALAVFLVALAVYVGGLPPTVTFEDAGELIVAADYLGVPHPPGYPIWTLANAALCRLLSWVRFYGEPSTSGELVAQSLRDRAAFGHPNPAWAVAFGSALFGALACAALALLMRRAGADALRRLRFPSGASDLSEERIAWVAAVSAGLVLAFTPVLWSQSVIAEVYSLNAFFKALLLVLLYRWISHPEKRFGPAPLFWVFGLGLTNHHTLLFLGPIFALALWDRAPRLFTRFLWIGLFWAGVGAFNLWAVRAGHTAWAWTHGPGGAAFWVHTALVVAAPVAVLCAGREGRTAGGACLLLLLGLAVYLYLPWASRRNPPMNWGYTHTWEGFLRVIGRGQYERIQPARFFSRAFIGQVGVFLDNLRMQFSFPVLLLGLLPFSTWSFRSGRRRISAFPVSLALFAVLTGLAIPEMLFHAAGVPDRFLGGMAGLVYAGLTVLMLIGLFGLGLLVVSFLARQGRGAKAGTRRHTTRVLLPAVITGLGLGAVEIILLRILLRGTLAYGEALGVLCCMIVPPAFLVLAWRGRRRPVRLRFDVNGRAQTALLLSAIGFFFLGVVFLLFQNLPLDVNSLFIGRVQFIPAHALYALWIGFGLLGTLAFIARHTRDRAWLRHSALVLALGLPLAPIWENAFNPEQIRLLGGTQQRRHIFGWQFGDWLLRGEDAIRESLTSEEWARYPTPGYPPPLKKNAILFGGSDAGRFIPTYMIFSAKVRPDVFLLTQNALADPTYLASMRDLYGDRISLPTEAQAHQAFQDVLEPLMEEEAAEGERTGRVPVRRTGTTVTIEGLSHVMEINAILARRIFRENRERHAFYIEEGFPLPWMHDYQEPHGLILRMHPEPVPLSPERVRQDRDFWDWVTQRLTNDPRFLRDVPARRAFSGLRVALGRFYQARGLDDEAETAFVQALTLFPMHTLAGYHLADIYLRRGQVDPAAHLLTLMLELDPLNRNTHEYLAYVRSLSRDEDPTPP